MSLLIPTQEAIDGFTSFREEIDIDNNTYFLTFDWNSREESWSIKIADADENTILSDIKIVSNYELISIFTDERLPKGQLFCLDMVGNGDKINQTELGDRYKLLYLTAEEVESFGTV